MSGGIVDYGCTSDEETCANILRQKRRSEVHSMEEFRLRNNKELQGNAFYEAKQYAEMSVKSNDGNEKDEVDAVPDDLVTRININIDGIESEKNKTVSKGIKGNDDKYEIHTEVMKGEMKVFSMMKENLMFLKKSKVCKKVLTSVITNVHWLVIVLKVKKMI